MNRVTPILLLGIGGAGAEVLNRVRKQSYLSYGTPVLPHLRFLHLDLDDRNAQGFGRGDVLADRVGLLAEERRNIDVPGAWLAEIAHNPEAYKPIHAWCPGDLLGQLASQDHKLGAASMRALGRLGFWLHHGEIKDHLEGLGGALSVRPEIQAELDEIELEDGPAELFTDDWTKVIIVCSLAGGTGSGCFLDLAFLVRQLMPRATVFGHFMLPELFADMAGPGREQLLANGYAALRELEHFQSVVSDPDGNSGEDQPQGYQFNHNGQNYTSSDRPFDQVYLLDRRNEKQAQLDGLEDLFDLVAYRIFLESTPSAFAHRHLGWFAGVLQETQTFHRSHLSGRTSRRSYASYGSAGIIFDKHRLRRAAAHQLVSEVGRVWSGKAAQSPGGTEDNVKVLARSLVGHETMVRQALTGRGHTPLNRVRFKTVWPSLDDLRDRIAAVNKPGDLEKMLKVFHGLDELAAPLGAELQRLGEQSLRKCLDPQTGALRQGEDESAAGEDLLGIRHNLGLALKAFESDIRGHTMERLANGRGPGSCRPQHFLRLLRTVADAQHPGASKEQAAPGAFEIQSPTLPDAREVEALAARYTAARRLPWIMGPIKSRKEQRARADLEMALVRHLSRAATVLLAYVDQQADRLEKELARVYRQAADQELLTTDHYQKLHKVMDHISGELERYEQAMGKLVEEHQKAADQLRREKHWPRNMYMDGDIEPGAALERYLNRRFQLSGQESPRQGYLLLANQFFSEYFEGLGPLATSTEAFAQLFEAVQNRAGDPWQNLVVQLERFCARFCQGIVEDLGSIDPSVITPRNIHGLIHHSAPYTSTTREWEKYKEDNPGSVVKKDWLVIPGKLLEGREPVGEDQPWWKDRTAPRLCEPLMVQLRAELDRGLYLTVCLDSGGSLLLHSSDEARPIFSFDLQRLAEAHGWAAREFDPLRFQAMHVHPGSEMFAEISVEQG